MHNILQLKIYLKEKPEIWRRFLVSDFWSFHRLHRIIQEVMGWENYHLYYFEVGKTHIEPPCDDYYPSDEGDKNAKTTRIFEFIEEKGQKFKYEYDFGDGWEHSIILEKILPPDNQIQTPECIAGKRNCPPEDCGGIWGYSDMLDILKQPDHEEYESYSEWLGDEFDPEYFDKDEINKMLKEKDFGCIWL